MRCYDTFIHRSQVFYITRGWGVITRFYSNVQSVSNVRNGCDSKPTSWCDGVVAGEPFKKKCLKDQTVPEYPVNVYYCNEESKGECCMEDTQYTCCEPRESLLMYVRRDNDE